MNQSYLVTVEHKKTGKARQVVVVANSTMDAKVKAGLKLKVGELIRKANPIIR